jgi:AcrR family transcriptional regulator
MSTRAKRSYASSQRNEAAAETRARVLRSAKSLFARRGIEAVTIADVAERARVSTSTIYGLFKSKEGVLRALMEAALFGGRYQAASAQLDAVSDPVQQIAMTAAVARAIYENEAAELGLIRGASAFSVALAKMERTFEEARFSLQQERVERLYAAGKAKRGLPIAKARRLVWMYTSRDVYRLLVQEGGWTADEYEAWLSATLVEALVGRPTARRSCATW